MKIILSRKGFDSSNGGVPMPVIQGHGVRDYRKPTDVERLVTWLAQFPAGRTGDPIDRGS